MGDNSKSRSDARHDRNLRLLEVALSKATERWRLAKRAAKDAKADAKIAKKTMKHARKALVVAQEEPQSATTRKVSVKKKSASPAGVAPASRALPAATQKRRRIAESPETVRKRRRVAPRKKSPVSREPSLPIDRADLPLQKEPVESSSDENT